MEFLGFLFSFMFAIQITIGFTETSYLLPSAELVVTATDQNNENNLITKRIDDNLTLTCTLVIRDNSIISDENNIELNWSFQDFPFRDLNRSRTIWTEKNSLKLFLDFLQPSDAGKYTCITSLPPISKADVFLAVRPPNLLGVPYCSASMFFCGDIPMEKNGARCIPQRFLCDGRPDCPFPSRDEDPAICGSEDPCAGKLRCSDGRCISKSLCCNDRWNCLPHPCCEEHMPDGIVKIESEGIFPTVAIARNSAPEKQYNRPNRTQKEIRSRKEEKRLRKYFESKEYEKIGGGLRKDPNEQLVLQMTLYKACVCFFVILVFFIVLIVAICRTRITLRSLIVNHIETQSPESLERHEGVINCSPTIPSLQDCRYSLVCHNDLDCDGSNVTNNRFPPSYSDLILENNRNLSSSDHMPNSSSSNQVSESDNNQSTGDNVDNSNSPQQQAARRPNDFGMGFIANAIFNSRYRPVPQQNLEITSLDYGTDSDSSCRSPGNNVSNQMNTMEFNSHFYGERIGGTPDVGYLSENRRARHSNALDRILDRFGLNAPYNVDVDRDYNRNTWERQSFLSPPDYEQQQQQQQTETQRPIIPYVYSVWSRLKDIFSRNDVNRDAIDNINQNVSNNNNSNRRRRRPDTPDVPEPFFNMDFSQRYFQQQRSCFNGRLVPPHNFPPPYTQYAPDPPPPYVSRENLLSSRINLDPDQNGNVILEDETTTTNSNDNDNLNNNISVDTVDNNNIESIIETEPVVALNSCDDNGNVEQPAETEVETQERDSTVDLDQTASVQEETSEKNGPTEECGLTFPPNNLEFIDSDSILEHSVEV